MRKFWVAAVACALIVPAFGGYGCKKKPAGDKKDDKGDMAAMDMPADAMGMPADAMKDPRPADRRVAERPKTDPPVDKDVTPEGVLSEVTGTVEIRRSGDAEFTKADKDAKVFAKDAVRVGKDGEATLALWDNSSVELTPESAVTLNNSAAIKDPAPSVTVMAGAVRFDINEREEGQGPFSVYTPSSVVNVQGTVLAVGVGLSGSSRIAVEEGKVELVPVAKVDAKPVVLPQGKVIVVPYNKAPAAAIAYKPDSWDAWLEGEDNKAVKAADDTAKLHADQVNGLADDGEKLDAASDKTVTESENLEKQALDAAAKKDVKIYKVVQPKIASHVDTYAALYQQRRYVNSRLAAHAYLLALMRARAKAGVYKVNPKVLKRIIKQQERAMKRADRRRVKRSKRQRMQRRRLKRLRRAYLYHHARGRALAPKIKTQVPEFYRKQKLRRRMRRRAVRVEGYTRPLYRRPRYVGKYRKVQGKRLAELRRQRNWHKNQAWKKRRKARRVKRAAKRAAWRKVVIQRRMKRWSKRPRVRIHRRARVRRQLRLRGMDVRGMGVRGMGPRDMKRDGMGRFGMKRDGMGPRDMKRDGMGRFGMRMGKRHGMRTPEEIKAEIKRRRKLRRKLRRGMGMGMGM